LANYDSERERFQRLSSEGIDSILEAIKTSSEPWHGFYYIQEADDAKVQEEAKLLIIPRIEFIKESIESSRFPSVILYGLCCIPWIFSDDRIILASAKAIRDSEIPWNVFYELQKVPGLTSIEAIQTAVVDTVVYNVNGSPLIRPIIEDESLIGNHDLAEVITTAIEKNENCHLIIQEAFTSRAIYESKPVWSAIENRLDDIIKQIQNPEKAPFVIYAIRNYPPIIEHPLIVESIVESLETFETSASIIFDISDIRKLMSNPQIQRAVATLIRKHKSPWDVLYSIRYSRELLENKLIQQAIDEQIDYIAEGLRDDEYVLGYLYEIPSIMNHPVISLTIKDKIPDIIRRVHFDDGIMVIIDIMRRGSSVSIIYDDPNIRSEFADYIRNYQDFSTIKVFAGYSNLMVDPSITDAIIDAIRNTQIPSYFVDAVTASPVLMKNNFIQSELGNRLSDIIKEIKEGPAPWIPIKNIIMHSHITENKAIQSAIFNSIGLGDQSWMIFDALKTHPEFYNSEIVQNSIELSIPDIIELIDNETPLYQLAGFLEYPSLKNNSDLQVALQNSVERYAQIIRSNREYWWSLKDIGSVEYLRKNGYLQTTITERVADLVHEIRTRFDPWNVIEQLNNLEFILDHESIISGLVFVIENNPTPWNIGRIKPLEKILENDSIKAALTSRADDIAFMIDVSKSAHEIINLISRIEFLVEMEQISHSIHKFNSCRDLPSNIKDTC